MVDTVIPPYNKRHVKQLLWVLDAIEEIVPEKEYQEYFCTFHKLMQEKNFRWNTYHNHLLLKLIRKGFIFERSLEGAIRISF